MAEYIEKESLLKNFCGFDLTECVKYGNRSKDQACKSYDTLMMYEIADEIENAPSADVAPVVHGKWVYNKNATDWGIGGYVCSECQNKNNNLPCNRVKSVRMFSGAKYCPECGAKMDVEQEE